MAHSTSSRTNDAVCSIEGELKRNAPYILTGLGVSGGLLLLLIEIFQQ